MDENWRVSLFVLPIKQFSSVIAFNTNLLAADCVGNARFCGIYCKISFVSFA